jgi:hypothetical protein
MMTMSPALPRKEEEALKPSFCFQLVEVPAKVFLPMDSLRVVIEGAMVVAAGVKRKGFASGDESSSNDMYSYLCTPFQRACGLPMRTMIKQMTLR